MLRRCLLVLFLAFMSLSGPGCRSHDTSQPASKPGESTQPHAPDNTAVNERDRSGTTMMPTDQQSSDLDLKITKELREAVVGDDALSFDAKNIKIITSGAVVTLRGPVKSEQEKQAIEARARRIPGVVSVNNELEFAAAQ
jgi:osmotically-inducible protein OsmY